MVLPEKQPISFKIGDIIWAKAHLLPGWPGKIISYKKRNLDKPAPDKVSACAHSLIELIKWVLFCGMVLGD